MALAPHRHAGAEAAAAGRCGSANIRWRARPFLLHAEQGLGDTIQFARYVPLLAQRGAKVVLEVHRRTEGADGPLEGAAAIVARGEAPPPFDVHCPLGSLPLAFKTEPATVPAQIPYLPADEAHLAKWSARLGALDRAAGRDRVVGQCRAISTTAIARSHSPARAAFRDPGTLRQHPARRTQRGRGARSPANAA